jgi:predicted dehydrogenase
MNKTNRRTFIKQSALAAAALSVPLRSRAQISSASDEIGMAVIGFHGRGGSHIAGFSALKGVRIAGLCDVDERILGHEVQKWKDKGVTVAANKDMRKILEDKNVDAVSIATPNHWHALAAIWAIQAGKDVYVEKPVCHNVWEGRKIVEAARKYKRIVQTGTQSRSSYGIRQCFDWIKEGHLGKIKVARGFCYKPRPSIGKVDGPQPIPPGIDYDLWCGPAPMKPLHRKNLHYDWHWIWDTGNGDLGNQGIHQMDIARWALGETKLSPHVLGVGGRLGYDDDGETPNTFIVYHDYEAAPLIFEVRGLPEKKGARDMDRFYYPKLGSWKAKDPKSGKLKDVRASIAVVLELEGGYVVVPNYNEAVAFDLKGQEVKRWRGSDDHFANFIKAVRSRKHTDLNADIEEGFISSSLCHTGNISYLTGREAAPEAILERLHGKPEHKEAFARMQAHLDANEVDLQKTRATLGAVLKMDPNTERFINDDQANKLLTRDYRKPYVVPDMV